MAAKWTGVSNFSQEKGNRALRRPRRVNCRLAGPVVEANGAVLSAVGLSAILGLFQLVKINDVKRNFVNGNCLGHGSFAVK